MADDDQDDGRGDERPGEAAEAEAEERARVLRRANALWGSMLRGMIEGGRPPDAEAVIGLLGCIIAVACAGFVNPWRGLAEVQTVATEVLHELDATREELDAEDAATAEEAEPTSAEDTPTGKPH